MQGRHIALQIAESLNPVGPVQKLPFGLEQGDLVFFLLDFYFLPRDLLAQNNRVIFDAIGINRRPQQQSQSNDHTQAPHHRPPFAEGERALWHCIARNLAERERGLRRSS